MENIETSRVLEYLTLKWWLYIYQNFTKDIWMGRTLRYIICTVLISLYIMLTLKKAMSLSNTVTSVH